jgi:DNA-binding LacI/PurR family transcriptional regulator
VGAVARSARRPTLADLAAAAGVSRATASNAFNRPERLSAALRDRLLALAEEIGYAGPDPRAAALRRGRVGAIGVVLADRLTYAFSDPAALQILDGIAEAVAAADTALLLLAGDGTGGGPDPARVTAAAVDGFVSYCLGRDDPALAALSRRRLPAAFVDQSPGRTAAAVDLDEEGGVRALTEHLLGLGHRRFGIVTLGCCRDVRSGPVDSARRRAITFTVVRRRLDAAIGALSEAGVEASNVLLYEPAHNVPSEGEQAATWLLGQSPRPTALMCQSDQLAIGALIAASRLRYDVPDEVSITGFDDIESAAETTPALTTVHQPLRERGRLAGELVLELIAGGRPRQVRLPTELVVRGSTGKVTRRRRR